LITSEKDISYLADPVDRIRKDIKEVTYEEVVELKEQLLSPERLACAIVKSTD
jgi:predicted Zn-dependent peptidase